MKVTERAPTEVPAFCPRCGRPLEEWGWVYMDNTRYYPTLACWNGKPRWMVALLRLMSVITPEGAHYVYEFPSEDIPRAPDLFDYDRRTGRKLP